MASLKEIAREYRDEIMDGIAWVAIWKTGRSWNAKAFWLNLETERIEDETSEQKKVQRRWRTNVHTDRTGPAWNRD